MFNLKMIMDLLQGKGVSLQVPALQMPYLPSLGSHMPTSSNYHPGGRGNHRASVRRTKKAQRRKAHYKSLRS